MWSGHFVEWEIAIKFGGSRKALPLREWKISARSVDFSNFAEGKLRKVLRKFRIS